MVSHLRKPEFLVKCKYNVKYQFRTRNGDGHFQPDSKDCKVYAVNDRCTFPISNYGYLRMKYLFSFNYVYYFLKQLLNC